MSVNNNLVYCIVSDVKYIYLLTILPYPHHNMNWIFPTSSTHLAHPTILYHMGGGGGGGFGTGLLLMVLRYGWSILIWDLYGAMIVWRHIFDMVVESLGCPYGRGLPIGLHYMLSVITWFIKINCCEHLLNDYALEVNVKNTYLVPEVVGGLPSFHI